MAINNGGQVVGRSDIPSRGTQHVFRAFLWTNAAGMKDLGSLSGRQWAQANDLNEIGLVVGQTWLSSGQSRATLWRIR
jgi:probable HAF family extracellular repeat protein